ncbi:MAG: gamma-glutamylputrescine oxidase [Gammaproteobacteria bacterium]|jgi:gamma-glutamylputrescine oxidase
MNPSQSFNSTNHIDSYYVATANQSPTRSRLESDIETDVCVIGAGFSGISSALHLAEKGYRVVVLEASRVGWGASGRNGGQIVNGFSRDLIEIEGRYGFEAASAIGQMSLAGGDIIRQRIDKYDIKCDLKPGNVFAAFRPKQLKALEAIRDNWQKHGHDQLEMLGASEIRQQVNTDCYIGGLLDHRGGHIHPLNLCLGEAAAFESLGGQIFEQSAVTGIKPSGDRQVVNTEQGSVTANKVVVCGNAYLGNVVPQIANKIMPVSTQIITTEVLGEKTCLDLMPGQICVEDTNYMLDYYRMTADHRLLFGGGSTYGGTEPANIETKLRSNMEKTFPQLKGIGIDFAWSGNFALTMTRIPHFGQIGDNVFFIHGYSGHGVTATHLAGKLIAQAIDGQPEQFNHFSRLPYFPLPGGRLFRVPLSMIGSWWYIARDKLGI